MGVFSLFSSIATVDDADLSKYLKLKGSAVE
jgi:hypothetical protein